MSCANCGRDFHGECLEPTEEACCCAGESSVIPVEVEQPKKLRDDVTESAGRKRAAVMWPVDRDANCEWQMQGNCGGGFVPITGCLTGKQRHIHHGPDKTTTNNERENISLICTPCHNRWHAKNDPLYGEKKCPDGINSKKPRPMTPQEMIDRAGNS